MTATTPNARALRKMSQAVADKTADAYSFDRYSTWRGCAWLLALRGYNARQIEAILRSKWMRWAADRFNRHDRIPARAIIEFIDDAVKARSADAIAREVEELVAGTFEGEED